MKKIVMACGLLGLLSAFAAGCGGNKCEAAADKITAKYEGCSIDLTTTDGGEGAECTDEAGKLAECQANCFDAASCETLKGEDTDGALELADCISKC
ncbi:MAG: hypothetical protein IPK82_26490 [Polyangiaceae bacterium]|nr:hypothetical protein [Polyangiaceae bacterium]